MLENLPALLLRARRALDLASQGALGEALGSSPRSGQRWERGESKPSPSQLLQLIHLVYPKDPSIAGELAAAIDTNLVALGLEPPVGPPVAVAPPPPPPPPPPPDPIHIVDTVVCAAAEAVDLKPDAVRPALRAAFRRARLAGLSVEAVDAALTATAPPSPGP